MFCSAGVDGAYMAKLMPPVMGYALNAVSDISAEVLVYWYARLRQYPKNTKRYKMAWALLIGEVLLTGFAWLFGWRQLLPIITALEGPQVAQWLAPVLAAFTPTLLIAAGYTQALLAGRIESEVDAGTNAQTGIVIKPTALIATAAEREPAHSGNGSKRACPYCGEEFGSAQAVSAHLRWCEVYQAHKTQEEAMSEAYA